MRNIRLLLLLALGLSALASHAQTFSWGNVAMGGGGFVSSVITCPTEKNLIYARTDVGGAYRWEEASQSWTPITDWASEDEQGVLGTEALAIDPQAPNKLYILAGISYFNSGTTRILRSSDYGKTFTSVNVSSQFKAHGNGLGRQNGERLAVDPNKSGILFCGTRWNGLFKSTDDGLTWSSVSKFPFSGTTANENGISMVLFDKSSSTKGNATKTIYVGVSRMGSANFYASKDGGDTWAAVTDAPQDLMPQRAVLASDGNMYVTYGNGAGPHGGYGNAIAETMNKGEVYKFETKTGVWTKITPNIKDAGGAATASAWGGISVDAANPKNIIVATINKYLPQTWGWGDRIFKSTDGGATWTDLFSSGKMALNTGGNPWIEGGTIHWAGSLEIDPFNPERVFVTSGNGIFMTENYSAAKSDWAFCVKGLEETVPLDATSIPGGAFITVIGDYDGSTYTDTRKSTPIHRPSIGTTTGIAYAGKKTSFVVRVGGDDKGEKFPIFYSEDGGVNWTAFATRTTGIQYKGRVGVTADGSAVLWCAEKKNATYRTTDKGANWTQVSTLTMQDAMPVGDQVNPKKVYAYDRNSGTMMVSADGGATFAAGGNAGNNGSTIIRAVPNKEGDIWVALYDNGLTRSTNSGASFTKIGTVTQCGAVGFGKAATGKTFPTIYIWGTVGGVKGIHMSTDEGASWTRINDNDHEYGGPANGQFVLGDMNVFGKVYMSTAGRGTVVGVSSETPICEIPELGAGKTICSSSTLTLDPQLKETGYTFQWKRNGYALQQATPTISVYHGGDYELLLTKKGCPDYTDKIAIESGLIPASNDTVCPGSTASLTVTGSSTYNWYASASSTTPLATGLSYQPAVTASTMYYVADASAMSKTAGQTFNPAAANKWGLGDSWTKTDNTFTLVVTKAITLKSISLQVDQGGTNARIRFLNGTTPIFTAKADNLPLGLQPVSVNFTLQPGTYTVDAEGTVGRYIFQADKTSPIMSIDGYVAMTANSGWGYGIFFDWVFAVGNTCARTPVEAVVKECADVPLTQKISLAKGWNLISFYVSPTDKSIASVFGGVMSKVVSIKDMDSFYLPGQSTGLSGLSAIEDGKAYLVLMSADASLSATGLLSKPANTPLKAGWNLIGHTKNSPTAVDSFVAPMLSNTASIKGFDGFWMPAGQQNSLQSIEPGKGYFIKAVNEGSLLH